MSDKIVYELVPVNDGVSTTFLFFSDGVNRIPKAIKFSPLNVDYKRPIFNLGFGDYDLSTNQISDDDICNNGDQYYVFNTILNSIPKFFDSNPDAGLLVRGSDSSFDYPSKCRTSCKKNCITICKNFGRRIRNYCTYISLHYAELSYKFEILGIREQDDHLEFEKFKCFSKYEGILLFNLKKPNFKI